MFPVGRILIINGRMPVGPTASPRRVRPVADKMAVLPLRLHDFARENIQLTIFLFPYFGNLEGTNLIAAHD